MGATMAVAIAETVVKAEVEQERALAGPAPVATVTAIQERVPLVVIGVLGSGSPRVLSPVLFSLGE